MRLFVILLLVALTAVRSFAGDVMAIRMAMPTQASAVATVNPHEDCMGEHQAMPEDTQTAQDHCANCASCQACFTVALSMPVLQFALAIPRHVRPDADLTAFTSAVPALGQKPPIS